MEEWQMNTVVGVIVIILIIIAMTGKKSKWNG